MSVTFNGKPFNSKDFMKSLTDSVNEIASTEFRNRIASIRDPETGEFPIVSVRGKSLSDMSMVVEASPKLLKIVYERAGIENTDSIEFIERRKMTPSAFLSYTSEDRPLAKEIAKKLMDSGINVWWDQWEIKSGDSIVQKINDGLAGCTHFIVLLTPQSIEKPWVKTEMDAGFIQSVSGQSKFIALRNELSATALPALLKPLLSPEIPVGDEIDVRQLISDIHGLTEKPELGKPPVSIDQPPSPYSAAAMSVAEYFCQETKNAIWSDVQTSMEQISNETGLSLDDVEDALFELRNFIRDEVYGLMAENILFTEFDNYFIKGQNPADDALRLATDLNNDTSFPAEMAAIATKYGWNGRRLNPAVSYLIDRDLIDHQQYMGTGGWVTSKIEKTGATRRFVKSRL